MLHVVYLYNYYKTVKSLSSSGVMVSCTLEKKNKNNFGLDVTFNNQKVEKK